MCVAEVYTEFEKKKRNSVEGLEMFWRILLVLDLPTFTVVTSSGPEVLCQKDILKNFPKFRGKHLYQSLILEQFGQEITYSTQGES